MKFNKKTWFLIFYLYYYRSFKIKQKKILIKKEIFSWPLIFFIFTYYFRHTGKKFIKKK